MYFIFDAEAMEICGILTKYGMEDTNLRCILEQNGYIVHGDGDLRIELW